MFYWFLKTVVLGPILKLLFRPWVEGAEHVPAHGAAILASNHLSFSDSIFLPIVLSRRITFPAKMEYFTGSGVKGRLTAWFFKGVGQIPIDRSGGRASEAAISSGLKVLRKDELFGIYPEGTRSPDGRLYKGKTGIARMALEAGCPVIPVAMIGTDKAQPTGQKLPNIMRIGVRIGAPLDFSRYEGMENDRFVLRSITDEIMYELMLLSGQEYVDVYATSLKKNVLKDTVQTAVAKAQEIQKTAQEIQKTATEAAKAATEAARAVTESAKTRSVTARTAGDPADGDVAVAAGDSAEAAEAEDADRTSPAAQAGQREVDPTADDEQGHRRAS
ncbi:MAG: 1-acyl-sn-glycerol-3-phosphate acyltransferase [Actinomycetales bacterium]|nr:1-acyl-sn-glycerol-3-phosphate acyltransferase [Candidatus Phosphoribacter baldrii]